LFSEVVPRAWPTPGLFGILPVVACRVQLDTVRFLCPPSPPLPAPRTETLRNSSGFACLLQFSRASVFRQGLILPRRRVKGGGGCFQATRPATTWSLFPEMDPYFELWIHIYSCESIYRDTDPDPDPNAGGPVNMRAGFRLLSSRSHLLLCTGRLRDRRGSFVEVVLCFVCRAGPRVVSVCSVRIRSGSFSWGSLFLRTGRNFQTWILIFRNTVPRLEVCIHISPYGCISRGGGFPQHPGGNPALEIKLIFLFFTRGHFGVCWVFFGGDGVAVCRSRPATDDDATVPHGGPRAADAKGLPNRPAT
jgi:hypothetical protein